jgi:hypothetical protein
MHLAGILVDNIGIKFACVNEPYNMLYNGEVCSNVVSNQS